MNKTAALLAALLCFSMALSACSDSGDDTPSRTMVSGSVGASSSSSQTSSEPAPGESDEQSEPEEDIEEVNYAKVEPKNTMELTAKEQFYLGFATSLEISESNPTFTFGSVSQLADRDKYRYFSFVNSYLSLITNVDRFSDWHDADNGVWRIPVSAIRQQLSVYLGTDQFDPAKAFGTDLIKTSYAEVPLGYDVDNEEYVTMINANMDGLRAAQLLGFQQEGSDITLVVGFYDIDKFMGEYQEFELEKTYTLHITERSFEDRTFTLNSAYFTYYDEEGPTGVADTPQYKE